MTTDPVVVVGMGLAGTRCATTLRRLAPERRVVLVGDEPHDPYERPPLSKEFLARAREADDLTLPSARVEQLRDLGIDVRAGTRVDRLDAASVELSSGERLSASAIVLATGARPRELTTTLDPARLHVLRSVDDAQRLRGALATGRRLVIVGSGFIGAEVASTARAAGVEVTILEAEATPFARTLGPRIGDWLAARWQDAGVDLRTGCMVASIEPGDAAAACVRLEDGTRIDADDVLVAIGTTPCDSRFHAAFPGVGRPGAGIPVDAAGRTPITGVWAAGDVALVAMPDGSSRRVEHWTDASTSALRVAHDVVGHALPTRTAPYAWSDQFGVRLQVVGHPAGHLDATLDAADPGTLLVRYHDDDGQLCGIAAIDRPADVARYRGALAA